MRRRYTGRHRVGTAPGTYAQRAAVLTAPTPPPMLTLPVRAPLRLIRPPRLYRWGVA